MYNVKSSKLIIPSIIFCSLGMTIWKLFPKMVSRLSSGLPKTSFSVVYVTAPAEDVAKNLARGLVKEKLAACVNIIPKITSIYTWDDKVNEDEEILLIIKTKTSAISKITEYVKLKHPYEVPEVISIPIEHGSADYLKWIDSSIHNFNEKPS